MDDVCITFHVIANSSVRKSDKLNQNSARWSPGDTDVPEELGWATHAFPQTQDMCGILERERTPFFAEC